MKQEGTSVSERALNVLKLKLSQIFTSLEVNICISTTSIQQKNSSASVVPFASIPFST